MNHPSSYYRRVLAVDPYDQGLGFALFGGPEELMDWGLKEAIGGKSIGMRKALNKLIERYDPDVLITESGERLGSSRRHETRRLLRRICEFAGRQGLKIRTYSRAQVKEAFASFRVRNKHQIASLIADWFPELAPRLPAPRKDWMSENRSMNVFDAVSFALTFFHQENIYPMTAWSSPPPSLSTRGGITGSVSPGNDQDGEDAHCLSLAMPAFPSARPEKISPSTL